MKIAHLLTPKGRSLFVHEARMSTVLASGRRHSVIRVDGKDYRVQGEVDQILRAFHDTKHNTELPRPLEALPSRKQVRKQQEEVAKQEAAVQKATKKMEHRAKRAAKRDRKAAAKAQSAQGEFPQVN